MISNILSNVHSKSPLVHNITNYVTVNDCANVLLACGGSPIMADDKNEVCEITSICGALNINIGTLNERTVESMFIAGRKANELGHIVCLDPVGAGASEYRTNIVKHLVNEIRFDVIKGNASEIKTIYNGYGNTNGVDVSSNDAVSSDDLTAASNMCRELSKRTGAIIVITGEIDIVADGESAYAIYNGNKLMSKVSGTGCMLSAMLGAFLCANPDRKLEAAIAAVGLMGVSGERAVETAVINNAGSGTLKTFIIDEIYKMTDESLVAQIDYRQIKESGETEPLRNKMIANAMKVYAVTDSSWLKDDETLCEQIEKALKGGATFIQLREKEMDEESFINLGKQVKQLTDRYNVPLVINDNVKVAVEVGADGVHIGQGDMELVKAREILGDDKIIGVSVHNITEAVEACKNGADYLGVGAIFKTTSKDDARPVTGETLQEICKAVDIPVVAIGGINKDNIKELKGTGISGVAVISAIFAEEDIQAATETIKREVMDII